MSERMSQDQVKTLLHGGHVPKQKARRVATELVLELPHPGNACNPNTRSHWAVKAKAMKAMRLASQSMAAYELRKLNAPPPLWLRAEVQATFHRPGKRAKRADADNCISSLKGCLDGLQDAGIVANDSGLTHLPPIQVIGDAATERKLVLVIRPA